MISLAPFAQEKNMAGSTVNLDALIPRDDFVSDSTKAGGSPRQTIGISDLEASGFFQNSLRKPDFQRETTHWSPNAVVDLVRAFLDGDLIPAVILWERGDEIFVIDGAHRLSALLSWVRDDYGDGSVSNAKFGSGLADEQRKVAERTRALIRKEIGPYAEFRGLVGQSVIDPVRASRLSAIGRRAIIIQWVTAASSKAAEDSFFKINQAAQPIDPVERTLLQTREAPNAIASRCISRGGNGHKYWSKFASDKQEAIEKLGTEIHAILYKPPHSEPITSPDIPIAGLGYNALPFVFNLVSLANGLKIPNSLNNKKIQAPLPADGTGENTLEFLVNVRKLLLLVSTNDSGSLGFHPLIYYYARSGNFQPNAFLAALLFAKNLDEKRKKKEFTNIRERFEQYLHENNIFVTLTIHRLGSGARSLHQISDLYWKIFEGCVQGKSDEQMFKAFVADEKFMHLKQAQLPPPNSLLEPSKKGASKSSKSSAFIREAIRSGIRCSICRGLIHRNSITFDHRNRISEGGSNRSENLSPCHPFCNSGYKG